MGNILAPAWLQGGPPDGGRGTGSPVIPFMQSTRLPMQAREMLSTHPDPSPVDQRILTECVEACFECAQACTACADACLDEDMVADLRHCIRTDLDCADICATTGRVLSRQTAPSWDLLKAQVGTCLRACQECGEECRRHADHHEHCRVCGEACRRCEKACDQLLNVLEEVAVA